MARTQLKNQEPNFRKIDEKMRIITEHIHNLMLIQIWPTMGYVKTESMRVAVFYKMFHYFQ